MHKVISLKFNENEIRELYEGLLIVSKTRGFELGDGVCVAVGKTDSGLEISGKDNSYTVSYNEKSDFFRAVCLLVGLLSEGQNEISVKEASRLDDCGTMIDCSRNAVLTVDSFIDLLGKMASVGMNAALVYTEDTYEVEGYEYFGYMRGRYSIEELQTLDRAASSLGIELIPCIQTLAHLSATLRWSYASKIRDTEDILLIDEDETYKFIEAMFASCRKAYSTNRIHIGMDEAHMVGRGKHLDKYGLEDSFSLLLRHLNRVCELAKKYGFEPMMWSDMFFRFASEKKAYYDHKAEMPDGLKEKIPPDVSLVYWDYYNESRELYDGMIDKHFELSDKVVFVGGAWTWVGMGALYNKTFRATHFALDACARKNIKSIFVAQWGDDGAEVSVTTQLAAFTLYGEYKYYDKVDMAKLEQDFKLCLGYNLESFLALDIDDFSDKIPHMFPYPISRQIMYQDLLCGLFDYDHDEFNTKEHYKKVMERLENANEPGLEYLFDYFRALAKVLYEKATLGRDIKEAYDAGDKAALAKLVSDIYVLIDDYKEMHRKFEARWLKENKTFGYDVYDMRTGATEARMLTAAKRIEKYLAGEVDRIEELCEKRLPYTTFGRPYPLEDHGYRRIASASIF